MGNMRRWTPMRPSVLTAVLALVTLGIVFGVRVGAAPGTGSVAMQVQSAKP